MSAVPPGLKKKVRCVATGVKYKKGFFYPSQGGKGGWGTSSLNCSDCVKRIDPEMADLAPTCFKASPGRERTEEDAPRGGGGGGGGGGAGGGGGESFFFREEGGQENNPLVCSAVRKRKGILAVKALLASSQSKGSQGSHAHFTPKKGPQPRG